MQPRIPLPTDNIYKFYALFGLLIILTTSTMFFIRLGYYNTMAFDRYIPIKTLELKKELNPHEKMEFFLLQERRKLATVNKEFEMSLYVIFFIFGWVIAISGFYHWQREIQPKLDKLLDLQIRSLEVDLQEQKLEGETKNAKE